MTPDARPPFRSARGKLPSLQILALAMLLGTGNLCDAGKTAAIQATYREVTGSRQTSFKWDLTLGDELILTIEDPGETFRTSMADDLQTRLWELHRQGQNTHVTVRRDGDELIVQGVLNGSPVNSVYQVGDLPWLQALSVSLARHLPQPSGERDFWFLRPDILEPQRMRVIAVEEETLLLDGASVATWRVEIRPAGLLSSFWHGLYWFRQSDRRFLRFRAASGPPGSPVTEIDLVDEAMDRTRTASRSAR